MNPNDGYRFERKWVLIGIPPAEVELRVGAIPALFTRHYPPRWINNIYLDTPALRDVRENTDGTSWRTKARIRWYGEPFDRVVDPVLEFKIKRGVLGRKVSSRIAPFELGREADLRAVKNALARSDLNPEQLRELGPRYPTLLNRYWRKYYRSADGRFRLTIDQGMCYCAARSFANGYTRWIRDEHKIIVELKYDQSHGASAPVISRYLPYRLSKSSKYVTGMQLVYPNIPAH